MKYDKLDETLRNISKCQDLSAIAKMVDGIDLSTDGSTPVNNEFLFYSKLGLLILRTLTDKGFKSKASMLSQEYMGKEDLDGDQKIYGIDWHYEDPPPVLQHIPKNGKSRKWKDN